MSYQINTRIPLAFKKSSNGVSQTGLSVSVTVRRLPSGSAVLTSQALTEVVPGLYTYDWSGSASPGSFIATYTEGGRTYDEFFDIEDLESNLDSSDGRAV